jgi:hypothetical protein
MENLETQEKVINLGKKLVSSFQQRDPDQVTTWMINYLSEQMEQAENGACELAKKNCFVTILQLWESHSTFPNGTRPFESFEPIFRALDSLSPENHTPRYYHQANSDEPDKLGESENWLEMTKRIDATAKTLITFMFEQAVLSSCSEETKEWINTLAGTIESSEVEFILRYSGEKEPDEIGARIENLTSRINHLETFETLSKSIRHELKKELNRLE